MAGCRDTALHEAAARGRLPVVELLLSRGADVHAKDNKGCAAEQSAAHDSRSARQHATGINHRCNSAVWIRATDNTHDAHRCMQRTRDAAYAMGHATHDLRHCAPDATHRTACNGKHSPAPAFLRSLPASFPLSTTPGHRSRTHATPQRARLCGYSEYSESKARAFPFQHGHSCHVRAFPSAGGRRSISPPPRPSQRRCSLTAPTCTRRTRTGAADPTASARAMAPCSQGRQCRVAWDIIPPARNVALHTCRNVRGLVGLVAVRAEAVSHATWHCPRDATGVGGNGCRHAARHRRRRQSAAGAALRALRRRFACPSVRAAYAASCVVHVLRDGSRTSSRCMAVRRRTALHAAAGNGRAPVVKALLTAGADVNAAHDHGCAPHAAPVTPRCDVRHAARCARCQSPLEPRRRRRHRRRDGLCCNKHRAPSVATSRKRVAAPLRDVAPGGPRCTTPRGTGTRRWRRCCSRTAPTCTRHSSTGAVGIAGFSCRGQRAAAASAVG